jgi:hypothetical protein
MPSLHTEQASKALWGLVLFLAQEMILDGLSKCFSPASYTSMSGLYEGEKICNYTDTERRILT